MTPPRICPSLPDCPLYEQRVLYTEDEPLRRAILMERHRLGPSLSALIRAEAAVRAQPPQAALPPAPEPLPLPILGHLKGVQP
jgi:hypothetical protein